jgi:lipoprotein-releasing system ATP-binding protein
MLNVAHVSKDYPAPGGSLSVLADVSFSLEAGDAVAVTGPSGSGKSSLLYILGGLEPPSSGTVTLEGQDPFQLPADGLAAFRNRSIGFVFQDHCLLPQCTVLENVLVPTLVAPDARHVQGERHEGAIDRARRLVDGVGLSRRIDHRPGELSGGERQRVAIARALVRGPRLLLCDEPTGNLDRASADQVTALLLDLHRQQHGILIVVTHNAELASRFPIRLELQDRQLHRV